MNSVAIRLIQTVPFGLIVIAYLAQLGASYASLPPRLAVHFSGHDTPDQWMSPAGWAVVSTGVLLVQTLIFVLVYGTGTSHGIHILLYLALPVFYAVLAILYVAFRHVLSSAVQPSSPNMLHLLGAGAAGLGFGIVLSFLTAL